MLIQMKTFIVAMILTLMCSTVAGAESCANGAGTVVHGINGTRYCKSRVSMNWWSAFSWCDSMGGTLINIDSDCDCTSLDNCPVDVGCNNLKGVGSNAVWTSVPFGSARTYGVTLSSGAVSGDFYRSNLYYALCRF